MKKVKKKNCLNCKHFDYIEDTNSDGYTNWNNSGFYCGGRTKAVYNLKSFPFKTEQKCCELKNEKEET